MQRTSVTISDAAGPSGLPRGVVAGFPERCSEEPVKMQDIFTALPSLGCHLPSIQPHLLARTSPGRPRVRAGDGWLKRTALRSHCLEKTHRKPWDERYCGYSEIPACYWTVCKSVWTKIPDICASRSRKHGLSLWSEFRHREACRCTVTSLLT